MRSIAEILERSIDDSEQVKILADIASSRHGKILEELRKTIVVIFSSGGLFLLIHFSQLTSAKVFNVEFSSFDIPYLLLMLLANYNSLKFSELRAEVALNDVVLCWCRSRQFGKLAQGGHLLLVFNSIDDLYPKLYSSQGLLGKARESLPMFRNFPFALWFLLFPLWSGYALWSSQRFPWWVCTMVSLALFYLMAMSILNLSYLGNLWDEEDSYNHPIEAPNPARQADA